MFAVYCLPKRQCILSNILPPPSYYLNMIAAAKNLLYKVARIPVLQTFKKMPVYVAIVGAVLLVNWSCQGTSLRWPGPKSCFQRAPQGGAESDFAHHSPTLRGPRFSVDRERAISRGACNFTCLTQQLHRPPLNLCQQLFPSLLYVRLCTAVSIVPWICQCCCHTYSRRTPSTILPTHRPHANVAFGPSSFSCNVHSSAAKRNAQRQVAIERAGVIRDQFRDFHLVGSSTSPRLRMSD
jgi:hypothetical protein